MGWADKLFEQDEIGRKPKDSDVSWSKILLEGEPPPGTEVVETDVAGQPGPHLMQTGEEPTGAISTITGKPEMRPVASPHQKAGFWAQADAHLADDPGTRMDVYSKHMGIPRERFGAVDGNIVYQGDDGVLYPVSDKGLMGGLIPQEAAGFGALVPHTPSMVLGSVAPFVGTAGGEGIRKTISAIRHDEPQTHLGNIADMGFAGLTGKVGQKVLGGGPIRLHDKVVGGKSASLIRLAGRDAKRMKIPEVKEMYKLGQKFGIDLYTPETTGSRELVARYMFLGDIPMTADKAGKVAMKRYAQIDEAVGKWLDSFAPATTTPESAGRGAVDAAGAAIRRQTLARQNAARPYYDRAYQTPLGDDVVSGLMEDPVIAKAVKGVQNKPVYQRELAETQNNFQLFDLTKRHLDDQIDVARRAGRNNEARILKNAKEDLLKTLDSASPDYAKARQIFSSESEAVEQLTGKGRKIGELSRLEGEKKVENAAHLVLSPSQSSPEIVGRVKNAVMREGGPEAWNALLRTHLKNKFREVAKTNTQNIGGQLEKRLFVDKGQREILEKAMDPVQRKNFQDFMKVLQRTGLTTGKESATMGRAISGKQMEEEAGGIIGKVTRPLFFPLHSWGMFTRAIVSGKRMDMYFNNLFDAMTDPKAMKHLQRMLQLKPGSRELIEQSGTFLGIYLGIPLREPDFEDETPQSVQAQTRPPQGTRMTR